MPILSPEEMQDIEKLLSRVVSWPTEGEQAFIGIHPTYKPKDWKPNPKRAPGEGDKLPLGHGAPTSNMVDALNSIWAMFADDKNFDMYFCLGTQHETEEVKWGRGTRVVAKRDIENTIRLQALRIDSDFKNGENGYKDQTEAALALSLFVANSGLPEPSIMVHTGGGFHIYWPFDKPLTRDEWAPLAYALSAATQKLGFRCDTNVTVDAARILRIPGTLNYKYDPPRNVTLHRYEDRVFTRAELEAPLEKYRGWIKPSNVTSSVTFDLSQFMGVTPPVPIEFDDAFDHLKEQLFPPVDLRSVMWDCGFIRDALNTGGADNDQTLWMYTTHLAVFTTQGRKAAHLMAKGHSTYSEDKTDEMFDRKSADRDRGVGPIRCATIDGNGAKACKTCKHRNAGGHPFNLARPAVAMPIATKLLPIPSALPVTEIGPYNYERDLNTGLWWVDDDGDRVVPTQTKLGNAYVTHHGPQIQMHVEVTINDWTPPFEITVSGGTISGTAQELGKLLGGLGVDAHDPKALKDMFMAWLEALKSNRQTYTKHPPYGWIEDENKNIIGFAYDRIVYGNGTAQRVSGGDPEILKQYKAVGSVDEWKAAALGVTNTYTPALDAILAAQFAGPLVKFATQSIYLNVYSVGTAAGKTTALTVGQAVWGDPTTAMQGLDDTALSLFGKIGATRNLPFNWDEIRGHEAKKKMAGIIFRLTSGRGKGRMKQDITQREVDTWRTLMVSASNESIESAVTEETKGSDAGFFRLFELEAPSIPEAKRLNAKEYSLLMRLAEKNYGVAGKVYAQWLGANHAQIEEDVANKKADIERVLKLAPSERFWCTLAAVLDLGAKYANDLGLTQIDRDALQQAIFARIEYMRGDRATEERNANSPEFATAQVIAYFGEFRRRVLHTNKILMTRQAQKDEIRHLLRDGERTSDYKDGFVAQIGQEQRLLRMAKEPFKAWLEKRSINSGTVCAALSKMGIKSAQVSIGAGLDLTSSGRQSVFDIELDNYPEFEGLLERVLLPPAGSQNVVPLRQPSGFNP